MNDIKYMTTQEILQEFEERGTRIPTGEMDILCESCGYNLKGLAGINKTCPECGTVNRFDNHITDEENRKLRKTIQYHSILAVVFPVVLLGCIAGYIWNHNLDLCCCFICLAATGHYYTELHEVFRPFHDSHLIKRQLMGGLVFTGTLCAAIAAIGIYYGKWTYENDMRSISLPILFCAILFIGSVIYYRLIRPRKLLPPSQFSEKLQEAAQRFAAIKKLKWLRKRLRTENSKVDSN